MGEHIKFPTIQYGQRCPLPAYTPNQSYQVPTTQPTIGYIYVLAESIVGSNQLSSTCQGLNIQTPTGVNAICLW